MRAHILPALFAATLLGTTAQAQQFEPGQDVIVNPEVAAPIVLHRHPQAPIHLHLPRHHHPKTIRKEEPATTAQTEPAPVVQKKPVPVHETKAAPPPAPAPSQGLSFPGDIANGAPPPTLEELTKSSPPVKKKAMAPSAAKAAPAAKTAPDTNTSAPAASTGLTKHSMILFAPKATDPASDALGAIKFLAGDLNAALTNGTSRIQIQAYGGPRGDKGIDARRLSLKRALSIRQILIKDGVPANRIDVRAMGGAGDGGPPDRVDVYIKN